MITDEQIAQIEKVAMKATPGKWWVGNPGHEAIAFSGKINQWHATHIAQCNPATILALIDRLRAAEDDARRYRWLRERILAPFIDAAIKEQSE